MATGNYDIKMWEKHGDFRVSNQSGVEPILGLMPSPTTGMG